MFSIDLLTVYHTSTPSEAVYHSSTAGPWFSCALGINGINLNDKEKGVSTNNDAIYPVEPDAQGNDLLSGVRDNGKKDEWN